MNTTTTKKIALVTGANQGIGFEIVAGLSKRDDIEVVLLGARDEQKGREAIAKLTTNNHNSNIQYIKIDLDDESSIVAAAEKVKCSFGGLDILINNAGMAWKGDAWSGHVASTTIQTNYFGTLNMCNHFLPLIRPHGRVVNVSSMAGKLSIIKTAAVKEKFTNPNLTIPQLNNLMKDFIKAVENDTYAQNGWPKSCYGISKVGVNALTRILIRDEKREDVLIFSVCPGWCSTAMSSYGGFRTAAKGAETPLWLSLLPPNSTVKPDFYTDQAITPW